MHLYGDPTSGNVYKVQLLAALTGQAYEHTPTDFFEGTKTQAFTAVNPNQKVPAADFPEGSLWESGAILYHLGRDSPFWPQDRWAQAKVLQWMFFEQYSHEPFIATARAAMHLRPPGRERAAFLADKRPGGEHALAVMEDHLTANEWFVGEGPSLADIALYAYTHVAHEGGFDLDAYPAIRAWIARVQALPGYVPMVPWPEAT